MYWSVVTIGLRSLAEVVLSEITGAAQTEANRVVPGGDERSAIWAAEYSAAVRRISLGRAMCQPDHADVGWFNYPDLESAQAFSPEGAAWLFARLDAAIVKSAADKAMEECTPISNVRASADYRRDMVGVLTGRAIKQALEASA